MKRKHLLVVILMGSLFISQTISSLGIENDFLENNFEIEAVTPFESWVFNAAESIHTSPAFIDVNRDRYLEIVFGSNDDYIYCINSTGHEVWKYLTSGDVVSSPAIADMNKDNSMDVVIASKDGCVYCLNSDGTLIWKSNMTVSITNDPVIADIEGDGYLEILVSDSVNKLYCLDNLGNSLWNYTSGLYSGTEPVVGNVNTTPELEIIIPGITSVITLNFQGNMLTHDTTFDPNEGHGMTLADLNNTGVKQLLLYQEPDNLICANATDLSEIYFNLTDISKTTAFSTPVVANIDSDTNLEIIVIAAKPGMSIFGAQGKLYNIESNGTITWGDVWLTYSSHQPLVCDLDANNTIDIITASSDSDAKYIESVDSLDNGVFEYQATSQITNSPLVCDIDNDGIVEILYPGSNGGLYCLELAGVSNSGKTYWSREKGSSFNTNSADRDGDYLDDLTEGYLGTNPNLYDSDSDQLSDWEEIYCFGTNPTDDDSDDDSLTDGDEVNTYFTNPMDEDSDDDTITDDEELITGTDGWITDPNEADTDSDGYNDNVEIAEGTDPTDPLDYPISETPTTSEGSFAGGFISFCVLLGASMIILAFRNRKR